jgi:hypothetical protein
MTPPLFWQPLRLLVLGSLFSASQFTMATPFVNADRSQSVVISSDTWSSRAGGRVAMHLVEREHPLSFAHASRSGVYYGQPFGASVFSRDGTVTQRDLWSASFLSDTRAAVPFASVTAPVPEPGTYVLMLAGLAAVGFVMRRRQRL